MDNRKKVLAFDVSETLQTASENDDDGGLGQPMIVRDEVIPGVFSVMVGGRATAELLRSVQAKGVTIVLVTNNGADYDSDVIRRTIDFLQRYGVTVKSEHYLGPGKGEDSGDKTLRLEQIMQMFGVSKDEIVFFDDSSSNIADARRKGFETVHVNSPQALLMGIRQVDQSLREPLVPQAQVANSNIRSAAQSANSNIRPAILSMNPADIAAMQWDDMSSSIPEYAAIKATFSEQTQQERHASGQHDKVYYWNTMKPARKIQIIQIALGQFAQNVPSNEITADNIATKRWDALPKELQTTILGLQKHVQKIVGIVELHIPSYWNLFTDKQKRAVFAEIVSRSNAPVSPASRAESAAPAAVSQRGNVQPGSSAVSLASAPAATMYSQSYQPLMNLETMLITRFEDLPRDIQKGQLERGRKSGKTREDVIHIWNTSPETIRVKILMGVESFGNVYPPLLSDTAGSAYNVCPAGWVSDNATPGMNSKERKEFLMEFAADVKKRHQQTL